MVEFHDSDILEINPQDADKYGLVNDDKVMISSPRHEIEMVIQINDGIRVGNLFSTFHFPDIGVNSLISSSADEFTDCPEYKVQAVAIKSS